MFKILKGRTRLMISLVLIILLSISLSGCGHDKNVLLVREGSFEAYPNVKIGTAFDNFFGDSDWKSFESEKGNNIVEFTGQCKLEEKIINVKVQFTLKGKAFEMTCLDFNDIPQNMIVELAFLTRIFENAKTNSK